MQRVCVFCGSNSGQQPAYREAARRMGQTLAQNGLGLVYGGGKVGLMGALADAALEQGAEVIGIIPQALFEKEVAHPGLSELRVVASMHERKALMADLADGFVALPGGFGTLEEFCEILTWSQLGIHQKPMGLLNTAGFYTPLLGMFDHAMQEGFVRPEHRQMILVDENPAGLLEQMLGYVPAARPKWISERES